MENVEILQVNTQPSVQSIASLRKEIKALKDQLVGLEAGTKEYNETLSEVANKTHQLKEIQEQVRRSSNDFGDQLSNVRGTVQGLSGAFQTVLGSLSLMGVEIGDDVKMLKMLQSAMAITQGVAAIDSGVKAFKALTISIKASSMAMSGLKKALITSGIGAAAVAVGVLVSKLSELKQEQEAAAEAARKHNEQLKEQLKVANQISKAESDYYNQAYNNMPIVQNLEKRLADNRAYWQEEYRKGNINNLELDKRIEDERLKYVTNAGQRMQQSWQEILSHNTEANWKESDEGKKVWKEYYQWRIVAAYGDLEEQKKVMQEWEEFTKKKAENVKAAMAGVADPESAKPQRNTMSAQENVAVADPQAETLAQERSLQALTDYYTRRAEIMISGDADTQEQLLQLDMDYRDRREELLRSEYEQGLIDKAEFNNQLAQLELEAVELQIESEEQLTAKTKEQVEKRMAIQKAQIVALNAVASSVSDILGSISDTMEQGTEEWKALKIIQATIDTIQGGIAGFMSGVNSGLPAPYNLILAAATAASVVATGMAQIAKIRSTQVSKNSSGGGSVSTPSASAVSVNATQVTASRNVQTDEDIANLPDTRVYVLEEDITNAQKKVEVTTENATY